MAGTTEVTKVLYIVVVSDEDDETKKDIGGGGKESWLSSSSFRYTRPVLQSTFQLMGCKARHAFKVHYYLCLCFIYFMYVLLCLILFLVFFCTRICLYITFCFELKNIAKIRVRI